MACRDFSRDFRGRLLHTIIKLGVTTNLPDESTPGEREREREREREKGRSSRSSEHT